MTASSPSPRGNNGSAPAETEQVAWHAFSVEEICARFGTSPKEGLSAEEAARRLAQYGPNELAEAPRPSFWQRLWNQFNNFIVILLIVAAIISAILGDYIESAAILAIVILNAILGLIQEGRAEAALENLQKLAAPEAQVIRGGRHLTVPARELVPGDLVVLTAGNYVPADLRLIETVNLRIEEAALTGESVPVEKDAHLILRQDASLGDRHNTAFMGTVVSYGRGLGVVTSTGMKTQIGLIAAMLQRVEQETTPLQRRLDQLGKVLGIGALAICAIVFIEGVIHIPVSEKAHFGKYVTDMFIIAVSLAVAAVPEGLPAVVTITLALGMREMVRRHALIRRLASVETLGSTTIICSDKTGTLTQNVMTVTRIWADGTTIEVTDAQNGEAFRVDGQPVRLKEYPAASTALWIATLANDAVIEPDGDSNRGYRLVGDPTETALLVAAAKVGATRENLEVAYPRVGEVPFDSRRKRMTTVHRIVQPDPEDVSPFYDASVKDWEVAVSKGAPDVLLDLCTHYQTMQGERIPLTDDLRRRILEANQALTAQALRVLGLAYRVAPEGFDGREPDEIERDFTFVGLVGMIDPPRPEVKPAMEVARRAGIRTMMITGDYAQTARAIAQQIGLIGPEDPVRSGSELQAMSDAELDAEVRRTLVYARVSPEHKLRIVEALQRNGDIVAMTGDGVNDAPALKKADIGVAMGITGTDVAKEASDMVLTDDNYASIVAAVEQGRIIYSNIRKFVYYLLSCNIAEIMVIFLAIMANLSSPLTAIQLLWLNLITDGAPALALGVEKGEPDIMERPPRPPKEPVINRSMWVGIAVQTVAITAAVLTAYLIGLRKFSHLETMPHTMAFVTLSFSELLRAFTSRSERRSIFEIGLLSNRYMFYAVGSSLLLLLAVVYVPFLQPVFGTAPLGWAQWEIVLPLLLVPSIAAEITKWVMRRVTR